MNKDMPIDLIKDLSSILVVGCGRVGSALVKELVKLDAQNNLEIYVSDVIKERAIRLSDFKPGIISSIKWKNATDTPPDIDLIILCVDSDSEKKLIDRVVLSKKNFISLSDDNSIFELYEKYEDTFIENEVSAIVGTGLFPGIGNVIADHLSKDYEEIYDVVVERLGFVSNSSLSSIKKARRDTPLGVRNTQLTESKKKNAKAYSWFVPPYNLLETQAVATGVSALFKQFPRARNISVRYSEPKLPTFKERVRHLFLGEQLTSKNACIKVQITGKINGEIESHIVCLKGDALETVCITTSCIALGFLNAAQKHPGLNNCNEYVEATHLFTLLYKQGIKFYGFN